jgi:methionyl-tRNA formyltransferase
LDECTDIIFNSNIGKLYLYNSVLVWGTGRFAYNCAKYVGEFTSVDCVYEYGAYNQSDLEKLCKKSNLRYLRLDSINECTEVIDGVIKSNKKTLIISASNTYIFPYRAVNNENIYIINYHPALIDKHKGRNAEAWAIYEEDIETGVTWHRVSEKVDNGAILAQRKIKLDENTTSIKLMALQYRIGFELFKEIIEPILYGEEFADYNGNKGKMHYSYDKPNDGMLDLQWDERKISAFLRSMDYGKLYVLGRPYVNIQGVSYIWDSYKIIPIREYIENKSSNCRVLIKKDKVFELSNFREEQGETYDTKCSGVSEEKC